MRATVRTECACCAQPIELQVDDQLRCRVISEGASPLVVMPLVDLRRLKDPSIIDAL